MKNLLLICTLTFLSWNAGAHNPLTAKVELNTNLEGGGLLNIFLSQAGLNEALLKSANQTDFSTISQVAYKKMAVQYIKNHIEIIADGQPLVIGEGAIKLGSHQTDLRFLINRVPQNIQTLAAKIDIGKENGNHHTVFWWLQKDGSRKVVLSERNDFKSVLGVNQPVVLEQSTTYGKIAIISFAIILLLMTLGWSLYPSLKEGESIATI